MNVSKSAPKMVVLHGNTFSISYSFRLSLVKQLAEKSMLAMVVSSYPDTEYIPEKYTNMSTFFPLTPMGLWGLICCLRTSKTFIFHGFTHTSNFIGVLAALFSLGQIPVICTITGMGRAFSYGGVAGSIIRNSIRLLYFFAQFCARNYCSK